MCAQPTAACGQAAPELPGTRSSAPTSWDVTGRVSPRSLQSGSFTAEHSQRVRILGFGASNSLVRTAWFAACSSHTQVGRPTLGSSTHCMQQNRCEEKGLQILSTVQQVEWLCSRVPRTHLLLPLLQSGSKDAELDLGDLGAAVVLAEAQGRAQPFSNHCNLSRESCTQGAQSGEQGCREEVLRGANGVSDTSHHQPDCTPRPRCRAQ